MPGRPVRVEARLVRSGLFWEAGIGGESVTFFVDRKKVGTSLTGGDGRAFSPEYMIQRRGNYVIRAQVTRSRRVQVTEGQAVLACWERRRPMLLIEAEALVKPTPPFRLPIPTLPTLPLPLGSRNAPVPDPDAASELARLTEFYFNPVYVTRSGRSEAGGDHDLRKWLTQHRFPTGLWVALNPGRESLKARIEEFHAEGWNNLKAGIGRSLDFAEVLAEHRMTVIIIAETAEDDGSESWPRKATVVKNWKEVRGKLR